LVSPSPAASEAIWPSGAITRRRSLPGSETYSVPSAATARPRGPLSWALMAGPPSPLPPLVPVPAIVVITPPAILRTRCAPASLT
jgi:hypothetical protein